MSQDQKEQFEESFQGAVRASLKACRADAGLRARLLATLANQPAGHSPPAGLEESELHRFETALGAAVQQSQEWAAHDSVALRVETVVGQEAGQDMLSERSVRSLPSVSADRSLKARYLQALTSQVKRALEARIAPPECRRRIEAAIATAATAQVTKSSPKVTPLRSRSRWKQGLVAVASVAAGFALIFGTLVGGAEKALADTVRKDHQRCCSALKGTAMQRCASYQSSIYGPLPRAGVAPQWTLVASRMCHAPDGGPMVHNVYLQNEKTLSLHFLPPEQPGSGKTSTTPRQIANGEFPVMSWEAEGWTVTACSTDLDTTTLAQAVGAP
jgi:hypothetical protein